MKNKTKICQYIWKPFCIRKLDKWLKKHNVTAQEEKMSFRQVFDIFWVIMFAHTPVLYQELLDCLAIEPGKIHKVVDATLWLGWHAAGVLKKLDSTDTFICIDADRDNLNQAKNTLLELKRQTPTLPTPVFVHENFAHLQSILERHGVNSPTHIYYDLGLNSAHVDDDSRGFSFSKDAPLDMRFDRTSDEQSAFDVVNLYSTEDLKRIFWEYGEEKKTPFIVDAIIKARQQKPIETTQELASIIRASSFDPKSTTRVFQAIRMEVNQELQVIADSFHVAASQLEIGGRIAVITFHSVEDRLVKQIFGALTSAPKDDFTGQDLYKAPFAKITRKPIVPTSEEITKNPRSRSAKLRCIEKVAPLIP